MSGGVGDARNRSEARTTEVRGIQVRLRRADHQKVRKAFLLSPDEEETRTLAVAEKNGRATISVPRLRTYALAAIQSE